MSLDLARIQVEVLEPGAVITGKTNIPMYLISAAHPHKDASRRLLEQAVTRGDRLVTDAEVLQEILHRYHAIRRPDAVHVAVMKRHGVPSVMSFDAGFDRVQWIDRMT